MRVIILLVVTTLLASLLSAADATFVFLTSALVKANGVGRAGNGNNRAVGVMDGTRKGGKGEGAVAAMDRKNSTKKKKKKKMMMKKKKTAKAKAPITPQAKNPIEALLKKTEVQQQLGSMVLSMVASRAIMKLDFKNQRVLQQSRVIFIVYLVASQLLFTYMRSAIEREDNGREITLGGAASFAGIPIPMLGKAGAVAGLADGSGDDTGGGAGGKTITVKEHDLAEVAKLSSSVMMEMVSTSYMHFSKGAGKPLLFVPLMGIVNKLRAPVVQVHVFNRCVYCHCHCHCYCHSWSLVTDIVICPAQSPNSNPLRPHSTCTSTGERAGG